MRIILALAACLGLAGCFISEAPLYAESEGACPIRAETQFSLPQVDAGGRQARFPVFTIAPEGAYCVRTNHAISEEPPGRALFVPIEDGWHVVQREQSGDAGGYLYQLARLDGDRMEIYSPNCSDFTPAALAELEIEAVEAPVNETTETPAPTPPRAKQNGPDEPATATAAICRVGERAQLEAALRRWIALRRPPAEYGERTR